MREKLLRRKRWRQHRFAAVFEITASKLAHVQFAFNYTNDLFDAPPAPNPIVEAFQNQFPNWALEGTTEAEKLAKAFGRQT